MYWLWCASFVVTMTTSGFALSSISSKFVKVGQSTPISAFECFDALRVDVAEADELHDVGVALLNLAAPHAGGALAGADDRVAPAARGRLRERDRRPATTSRRRRRRRSSRSRDGSRDSDQTYLLQTLDFGPWTLDFDLDSTVESAPSRPWQMPAPDPPSPSSCPRETS